MTSLFPFPDRVVARTPWASATRAPTPWPDSPDAPKDALSAAAVKEAVLELRKLSRTHDASRSIWCGDRVKDENEHIPRAEARGTCGR
jgi:hypothetical protein